jgi:hypothetical protein
VRVMVVPRSELVLRAQERAQLVAFLDDDRDELLAAADDVTRSGQRTTPRSQ